MAEIPPDISREMMREIAAGCASMGTLMGDTCETCRYRRDRQCRRNPPTTIISDFGVDAVWPRIKDTDWCGEWTGTGFPQEKVKATAIRAVLDSDDPRTEEQASAELRAALDELHDAIRGKR